MRTKWMMSFGIILLTAALWGCGSGGGGGSGGDSTAKDRNPIDPVTGISYAMASECIRCHRDFSWSADKVAAYLGSEHVINDASATFDDDCLACHDPIGDGPGVQKYVGGKNRAVVGCEMCHGPGGEHFGVGPMPNPIPDSTVCGKCHDALSDDHLIDAPEANNIATDYANSSHFAAGEDSHNSNICSKCHTDEGARLYVDVDNVARLETVVLAVPSPSHPVQCRTCHNAHNPGELLEAASGSASAEYRTCTNCHQAHDVAVVGPVDQLAGSTSSDGASNDGKVIYHAARWERIIAATHYDKPSTTDVIEGYAMDKTNERVCRDCHNVHAADVTINVQWAESGHGGDILTAKETVADALPEDINQVIAVQAAGAEDVSWVDDPWQDDSEDECQRCHTATGAKNFLNGPTAYYPAMNAFIDATGPNPNDFSYLVAGQQELLFCWACHTDNAGGMRNPGAVWLEDRNRVLFGPIPDIGKSTVCVGCHGGRANGEYIRNTPAASRSTSGRVHHLPAAGVLFSENTHTGYEFIGLNYVSAALQHDTIGLTGEMDGPCAGCHMPDANHHFEVVEKDGLGEITAITSQALCNTCHGSGMNATVLQDLSEQYTSVILLFHDYAYNVAGTTNYAATSFSDATFLQGRGDTTAGKNDYGVLQNYKVMSDGGGAWGYAHNSTYTKRIIFDSIDWLDNGTLNGTITIPAGYAGARLWFGADGSGNVTRP